MTNDEVEHALAGLAPLPARVDRDLLMYRAGQAAAARGPASVRRGTRFWQATTGLMTAATVALAFMQFRHPEASSKAPLVAAESGEPTVVVGVDEVPPSPPVVPPAPARIVPSPLLRADPSRNYLALRTAVLTWGVETWPTDYREPVRNASQSAPERPTSARDLLEELLPASPAPPLPSHEEATEASSHRDEESMI